MKIVLVWVSMEDLKYAYLTELVLAALKVQSQSLVRIYIGLDDGKQTKALRAMWLN